MRKLALQRLQSRLGYEFNDLTLLEKALTHRSFGANNNERFEFVGDSILDFVIAEALFHQFPKNPEGDLSRMRSHLVKGDTLAVVAREFQLSELVILGDGERKSGGHNRDSILADAVEAIIAAIYFDCGKVDTIRTLIMSWFESRLGSLDPEVKKDAKTQLQELLQQRKIALPTYQVLEQSGEAHALNFKVALSVPSLQLTVEATDTGRKRAEQAAAKQMLQLVKEKL